MQSNELPNAPERLEQLLGEVKALPQEYYELTDGRSLGVTGEIAEYEAARILGVKLAPVRQTGFDATREMRSSRSRGAVFRAMKAAGEWG